MSVEQQIRDLSNEIGGLHKKYSKYFESHYHINAVFSDCLHAYEDTILNCGFSLDGFDNALMSLGKVYFDLNVEVQKKSNLDNVGFEVLKAFEIGKSSTAKRLIYYLVKEVLKFNDIDPKMFKWNTCIFCGNDVYAYHTKCNSCNTDFKLFYETDDDYNQIIVEVAAEIDSLDMDVLKNLQKRIKNFLNKQNIRRIEASSTADPEYLQKLDRIKREYENIEDKFLSVELETYEAKAITLESFTLFDSSKKAIEAHKKELQKLEKYIESLNIKPSSSVYERLNVFKDSVSTGLGMIDEKAKLEKVYKDLKDLEKKVKSQLHQANGKAGYKLTQEQIVFELYSDFEQTVNSIDLSKLENQTHVEFLNTKTKFNGYFEELETLKQIKKDNDLYVEIVNYRPRVTDLVKTIDNKVLKSNLSLKTSLRVAEETKVEWLHLIEEASVISKGIHTEEGITNLKTLDEVLDQKNKINDAIEKASEQSLICDDLIQKIKYQLRKDEIENKIKAVQGKYSKIQGNVFFNLEFTEKERRKRIKSRLKTYSKLLDDLMLMKKDMRLLSDGIQLNSFDEQRDFSRELSDNFDMEYNRIFEDHEIVTEAFVEKTKKHRIRTIILLSVFIVLIVGSYFVLHQLGYQLSFPFMGNQITISSINIAPLSPNFLFSLLKMK